MIGALAARRPRTFSARGASALGIFPALALLLGASLLAALEPPSKPFLDKNSFYLTSAGFKAQFANDPAGKKALHALPPHRFVIHTLAGGDATSTPSRSTASASSSAPRTPIKTTAPSSPSPCRKPTTSLRTTRPRRARC
jgi:hypothetical protein